MVRRTRPQPSAAACRRGKADLPTHTRSRSQTRTSRAPQKRRRPRPPLPLGPRPTEELRQRAHEEIAGAQGGGAEGERSFGRRLVAAPEVAGLPARVRAAATGRASDLPEGPGKPKALARPWSVSVMLVGVPGRGAGASTSSGIVALPEVMRPCRMCGRGPAKTQKAGHPGALLVAFIGHPAESRVRSPLSLFDLSTPREVSFAARAAMRLGDMQALVGRRRRPPCGNADCASIWAAAATAPAASTGALLGCPLGLARH